MTRARPRPPVPRWEWVALAGVAAAGAAFRLAGLRAGLPGAGLLSPDEDNVVSRSIAMVHQGTANPHWFYYPSLFFSLTAGAVLAVRPWIDVPSGLGFASPDAYAADPSPYILAGRAVSVVAGLALIAGVWLLGRRFGGPAVAAGGAALVAVAPLSVAYSHLAVTDMTMTALLTFGLWQLVVAVQDERRRQLLVAAALIGLAASTKYNAGMAALPLLGAAWWLARRRGSPPAGALGQAAVAGLVAVAAFVAGTPYAVLDAGAWARDFAGQNAIASDGWLGFEHAGPGWWFNLRGPLWHQVGGAAVVLAAAGIALAARRRSRADVVLVPFALAYFIYVSTWNVHFDRYLLPVMPIGAVLAARSAERAVTLAARSRRRFAPAVAAVAAVGILAQPVWSSGRLVDRYRTRDARLDGAAQVERLVPAGTALAVDPLGPPVLDRGTAARLAAAGVVRPGFDLLRFSTPQPAVAGDPMRDVAALRARGIAWVITSDDIERRVRRAADRYPREVAFYDALERTGPPVLSIRQSLGPGARLWHLRHG